MRSVSADQKWLRNVIKSKLWKIKIDAFDMGTCPNYMNTTICLVRGGTIQFEGHYPPEGWKIAWQYFCFPNRWEHSACPHIWRERSAPFWQANRGSCAKIYIQDRFQPGSRGNGGEPGKVPRRRHRGSHAGYKRSTYFCFAHALCCYFCGDKVRHTWSGGVRLQKCVRVLCGGQGCHECICSALGTETRDTHSQSLY